MLKPPTEYVPPPPAPLIEDTVREKALARLKALVKGNGVRAERVTIREVRAQTLTFEARGFVRLATSYSTSSLPGRIEKGETIGSAQAFEGTLRHMTVETQRDPGKRQSIIDIILKRPDKGYGARDQTIKLESLARDFVSHEACPVCKASGKSTCGKCEGSGHMTCQTCHGRHNILCPVCRGRATITQGGKTMPCTKCRGKTRIQCPKCGGRGTTKCSVCRGAGQTACARCKASGYISHLAHVELVGHLHFDYDRQGLPIDLTRLLDAFAARYVEKGDIGLSIVTTPWQENEPAENIPIVYAVSVPYGEIDFELGPKKRITCTILGHNGELIKGPEFLDEVTKKGQALLAQAAQGQGNVGEHLRAAAKYRLLRDAIIVTAASGQGHNNLRPSLSKLLLKYPVGISSDKLLQYMMHAHRAMLIITTKPRLAGLAAGAVLYGLIAAGYFLKGQEMIAPYLKSVPLEASLSNIVIDVILLLIGAGGILLVAQGFARHTLKKSLAGLAAPRTIQRIMPHAGWALWASFALSALITGCFYFLV